MQFYGEKLRNAARWVLLELRPVNQAHSVFGGRSAYVGVNGWHDPGRSDGLSNWRILLCDVVKRWTMQDTNDFFGGIRFFTLFLRGQ